MMLKKLLVTVIFAVLFANQVNSQPAENPPKKYHTTADNPYGERNPRAPATLAEFDFVIGDWDVEITWYPPEGETRTYSSHWYNHWINNGVDVMQEWRGPFLAGSEFRHYNRRLGHWVGQNLYLGGTWRPTTAAMDGDNMVVMINVSNEREGEFINRETYFEITPNRWQMKSDRSYDEGETWVKGQYEMTATRSDSAAH